MEPLRAKGVEVEFVAGGNEGRIDLDAVSKWMVKNQLISLLVEGGQRVITSFLRSGAVDKIMVFVAPKLMGKGIEAVGDLGIEAMQDVPMMKNFSYRKVGPDILVEAYLK
jgi:riboflavin biosynthesis pyrimidine reductase